MPAKKSAVAAWADAFPGKNLRALADTMDEARPDPRALWKNAAPIWTALKPINDDLFVANKLSVDDAMQRMQMAAEQAQRA